jgi:hypothetical protein
MSARQRDRAVRYTTREMLAVESSMAERAQEMANSKSHGVGEGNREVALDRHSYLSAEQQEAVRFVTSERSIEALTGFAGPACRQRSRRHATRGTPKATGS